jgi:hypothetical protein
MASGNRIWLAAGAIGVLLATAAGAATESGLGAGTPYPLDFRAGGTQAAGDMTAEGPDDLAHLTEPLRLALAELAESAGAAATAAEAPGVSSPDVRPRRLPFLGEEARKRGYELPLPFGAGGVYYHLSRQIDVTEVRLGRNGAPLEAVNDFVDLGSEAVVDNVNVKFDVWLLPFLNVYAIAGYIDNQADTRLDVTLPPLVAGGEERRRSVTVPTALEGSVGGLGVTLAGGYKSLFFAGDVNAARADLGFDDDFDAVVSSLRVGWNGKLGSYPFRLWANTTYWDTAAVASGSIADPDGGTLTFEVDQGPTYPWTYGIGAQVDIRPAFNVAADFGADFNGGWYVAIVPVFRF